MNAMLLALGRSMPAFAVLLVLAGTLVLAACGDRGTPAPDAQLPDIGGGPDSGLDTGRDAEETDLENDSSLPDADGDNRPPSAPEVSITPRRPTTLDALSAQVVVDSSDPDGDTVVYEYRWLRDGAIVDGLTYAEVPAELTERGELWEVVVTPNDGQTTGESARSELEIGNAHPTLALDLLPAGVFTTDDIVGVFETADPDGDMVTTTAQWTLAESATAVAGLTLPATATTRGEVWTLTVAATDGVDAADPVSALVTILNSPPTLDRVELGPTGATVAQLLEATAGTLADADGDVATLAWSWTVDGTPVDGAIEATLPAGTAARGQEVVATAVPNDGFDDGDAVASVALVIANSVPTLESVRIEPDALFEATVATCIGEGPTDADAGDEITLAYTWFVNDEVAANTATLDGSAFDRGDVVACTVTPNDGIEDGAPLDSEAVTVGNTPPELASVTIAPDPAYTDTTLTAVVDGARDGDGDEVTFGYEWFVNDAAVAVTETLAASWIAQGDVVYVVVTPNDDEAAGEPVASPPRTIANRRPTIDSVTLGPDGATVADALVAGAVDVTDADADTVTLAWSWAVDGEAVEGADGPTLPAGSATRGQSVVATATPNDGIEDGLAVASAALIIANSPPAVASARIEPDALLEASEATCVAEGLDDADEDDVTVRYAWQVNGVPAADGPTLNGDDFSKADDVTCTATPNDGTDDGEIVTSGSVTVGNTPPTLASVSFDPPTPFTTDTLSALVGAVSDDDGDTPITFGYAWRVNGVLESVTDTLSASRFSKGDTVQLTVTPFDGTAEGEPVASGVVTVRNTPPVVSLVSLSPEEASTNTVLRASSITSDADGDPRTLTYAWFVDGVEVLGQTGSTLDGSTYFDRDQEVFARATANDGSLGSIPVDSEVIVVQNTSPTLASTRIEPGELFESTIASCVAGTSSDLDSDDVSFSYAWFVNGVAAGAGATLDGSAFDRGDTVACNATPSDGTDAGDAVTSAAVVVLNTPPTLSGATITPDPAYTSDDLSATLSGASDDDGDEVSFAYTWSVNGSPVGDTPTLASGLFVRGDIVTLAVSPTDGTVDGETVLAESLTIQNSPPMIDSLSIGPIVATTDTVLSASATASDADGDALTLLYQWYVDDVPLTGATDDALSGADAFDKDQVVFVRVRATDGSATSAPADSEAITIANSPPSALDVSVQPQIALADDTLYCQVDTESSDADGDALTLTYAWYVNDSLYGGPLTSTAYTGDTVPSGSTAARERWRCEVSVSDADAAPVVTSATRTVLLCEPSAPPECVGNAVRRCDASGVAFEPLEECSALGCEDGACVVPICTPSTFRCDGDTLYACSTDGLTEAPTVCTGDDICDPDAGACVEPACDPDVVGFCTGTVLNYCNALGDAVESTFDCDTSVIGDTRQVCADNLSIGEPQCMSPLGGRCIAYFDLFGTGDLLQYSCADPTAYCLGQDPTVELTSDVDPATYLSSFICVEGETVCSAPWESLPDICYGDLLLWGCNANAQPTGWDCAQFGGACSRDDLGSCVDLPEGATCGAVNGWPFKCAPQFVCEDNVCVEPPPPELLITEIADPIAPGGPWGFCCSEARFVELYNAGSRTLDLGRFELVRFTNGSTTPTGNNILELSGELEPGAMYVVCEDQSWVQTVFGVDCDLESPFGNNTLAVNGDDPIGVRRRWDGTFIDFFGQIGQDGTGTVWEYTSGRVERVCGAPPSSTTDDYSATASTWIVDGASGNGDGALDAGAGDYDPGLWSCTSGLQLPYAQDFEVSGGGWTAPDGVWEWGAPDGPNHIVGAGSGAYAWVTNLDGNYPNGVDARLLSPPLDFSSTTADPILRFRYAVDVETNWDRVIVGYSTDGGTTCNELREYNGFVSSGEVAEYVVEEVVLTGTAGVSTVHICWVLESDTSGAYEGFAVDDVYIGIYGCTDREAVNYDPDADYDDGSCVAPSFELINEVTFDSGGINGGSLCLGCAGIGCPSFLTSGLASLNADWHRICVDGAQDSTFVDTRIEAVWDDPGQVTKFGVAMTGAGSEKVVFDLTPGSAIYRVECAISGLGTGTSTMSAAAPFNPTPGETWILTRTGSSWELSAGGATFVASSCAVAATGSFPVYFGTDGSRARALLESIRWYERP